VLPKCNGHFPTRQRVSARRRHPPLRLPFHNAPSAPRSEAAPHAMQKTETPARNPKHAERRATPLAPLCLLLGVERRRCNRMSGDFRSWHLFGLVRILIVTSRAPLFVDPQKRYCLTFARKRSASDIMTFWEKATSSDKIAAWSVAINVILAVATGALVLVTQHLVRDASETAQRQLRAYICRATTRSPWRPTESLTAFR
jgi:hypothetical protein